MATSLLLRLRRRTLLTVPAVVAAATAVAVRPAAANAAAPVECLADLLAVDQALAAQLRES